MFFHFFERFFKRKILWLVTNTWREIGRNKFEKSWFKKGRRKNSGEDARVLEIRPQSSGFVWVEKGSNARAPENDLGPEKLRLFH